MNVLILVQGGSVIVQCLEYDMAVQGKSVERALKHFRMAVYSNAKLAIEKGVEPFSNLKAAPQKYWDIYKSALKIEEDFDLEEGCKQEYSATFRERVRRRVRTSSARLALAAC